MGIMDKLRAELVDIIEWVDDSRHTIVWRFPRFRNQIKHGAKLIVRPGQEAVFVHQGKVADVFQEGTHTLTSRNLPILSTLAGWPHGFDSPFKAEVYFVATRQVTDLKWGTPNPVMMRDPDFGPIRLRAFGTYTIKASDPKKLLSELVGTDSSFEADEISELLRSIINSAFADVLADSDVAVLDLASNYRLLAHKIRRNVIGRMQQEFGIDVPQLYIVNISLPAEVEQALDTRTSMSVVGDLGRFQQYQLGKAMPVAAENPAGGLAGAGVGLGMGLAMTPHLAPAPGAYGSPPPPPPPASVWHLMEGGVSTGPLSIAQVTEAAAAGRLALDTYVWSPGMTNWVRASQVPQIASLVQGSTPPPPPVD